MTATLGELYERVTSRRTGAVEHRFTVHSGERAVAIVTRRSGKPDQKLFLHTDHLGSVDVLTDGAGNEAGRRSYDAFGARRSPVWGEPAAPPPSPRVTPGFTGHASDDDLGLVNMKGRIYDPQAGRFLTPDPLVSKPHFGKCWVITRQKRVGQCRCDEYQRNPYEICSRGAARRRCRGELALRLRRLVSLPWPLTRIMSVASVQLADLPPRETRSAAAAC